VFREFRGGKRRDGNNVEFFHRRTEPREYPFGEWNERTLPARCCASRLKIITHSLSEVSKERDVPLITFVSGSRNSHPAISEAAPFSLEKRGIIAAGNARVSAYGILNANIFLSSSRESRERTRRA